MSEYDDEDDEKQIPEDEVNSVDMVGGIIRSSLDFISGNSQASP